MSSAPSNLGQYQIIREIARSNDIVYEAYDPLMNRRVAIKELSKPVGSTPQQLEDRVSRFRREAQAVGSLNHINIMTVFSFSEDQGRYFMAMEYLDGITLRKEIDNKGFLPTEQAIQIACDVLSGLAVAHDGGVVHRDIKPDNIQLTTSGVVKITDFGIARLTFQPNLTMDGQVFGTPSYMSPEQVVGRDIDQRTDLFSVAVMLYEMLTGNKPFPGDNVISITHAIVNGSPATPQNMNMPIWTVIQRALEKTPAMRYHNANEMRLALLDAIQPNPVVSAPAPFQATGFDPYAQPPASLIQPPVVDPYSQPYTPYGTPNPYYTGQPQAPISTPYAGTTSYSPYGAPAAPPVLPSQPVQYGAYNPYQAPMPGQYTPAPGQFYPPPPGPPLISAQARERMRHFVVALLVFALLAAIIVVAIITITNSMQNSSQGAPPRNRERVATADPKVSPASAGNSQAESVQRSNSPTATPEAQPEFDSSKPSPREIIESARAASTPEAKARLLVEAGDAFAARKDWEDAYSTYLLAYEMLAASGAPGRDLRKIVYKMIEVSAPGSPRRAELEALSGQL